MARTIALLACAAPFALAASTTQDASLRGRQVANDVEAMHQHRILSEDSSDGGGGEATADTEEEGYYKHVGCYSDSKENRVLGSMIWADDMTAKMCHLHCNVRGAFYMATQYGSECWCTREQDLDYASLDFGVCDTRCSGDEDESCGGYDAFDLYELVWPAESTDSEYLDCYNDKKEDRIMSDMLVDPDMTQAVCRTHCEGLDSMYYATQYGNECWCGSSEVFSDYEKHGEGTCHMACAGDSTQACGGFNAFSLYRFMDDDKEPSAGDQQTPASPTPAPQKAPTPAPVRTPTAQPVAQPTSKPVAEPTSSPEAAPTAAPVARTTGAPVKPPTSSPQAAPTPAPEAKPTDAPVKPPTSSPEAAPTPAPEAKPTDAPVKPPTPSPEAAPTPAPEAKPTAAPVAEPTAKPAAAPTEAPVEPDSGDGDGSFDDTQYSGEATYYGATTGGNCAYGTTVPSMYDGMIPVALNEPQYGNSEMCGACIEGEGSGVGSGGDPITGKFTAYVSDKCPECKWGDLDFSQSGDGRWEISWKFIPCPGASSKPSFIFEGSHEYYWKLQPRGMATPVSELSVNGAKGERTDDNFYIVTEGVPFYGEQSVTTTTLGGSTVEQKVAI